MSRKCILIMQDLLRCVYSFFFCNVPAPTEIYTLSLHDALPISAVFTLLNAALFRADNVHNVHELFGVERPRTADGDRSEEHTSELQSQSNLVCRLLLEKKKNQRGLMAENETFRSILFQLYKLLL